MLDQEVWNGSCSFKMMSIEFLSMTLQIKMATGSLEMPVLLILKGFLQRSVSFHWVCFHECMEVSSWLWIWPQCVVGVGVHTSVCLYHCYIWGGDEEVKRVKWEAGHLVLDYVEPLKNCKFVIHVVNMKWICLVDCYNFLQLFNSIGTSMVITMQILFFKCANKI